MSVAEVRRLLGAVHPLLTDLASHPRWPFPGGVPAPELAIARRLGRKLFG